MVTQYFTNRKINLIAGLGIVAVLLLTGCGGTTSAPASSSTSASTSTGATNSNIASATLKHVPHGIANISWDPTRQGLTVKISLIGLAPSSTHPANINSGSCVKQGAVVYPLQNVVADARGVGTSTTAIKNVTKIPASGWYINVHNGPNLAPSDQLLPIVCSDLTLTTVSPTSPLSLQVPLNTAPPASAGENVSGMAHLTLAGIFVTFLIAVVDVPTPRASATTFWSGYTTALRESGSSGISTQDSCFRRFGESQRDDHHC